MQYLNERLGHLRKLMPDMYDASSIGDFLESKDTIPLPSTWKIIDFLLGGKPRTSIMIDFHNVQLSSVQTLSVKAGWTINDGQSQVYLFPLYPNLDPKEMTRYGDGNYKRVRTFYVPKHDRLHLVRAIGLKSLAAHDPNNDDLEGRVEIKVPVSRLIH